MQITSRHNPKLKQALALRNRRSRESTGLTLVDGVREVVRAQKAGAPVEQLFVCEELLAEGERDQLEEVVTQGDADWLTLNRDLFARLAYGDRYDGAVAVVRWQPGGIEALELPENPLVVVVEGIEKPGNLGAILRSADGTGFDAAIVADPVIELGNPNTIRASVSTVFDKRVVQSDAIVARDWLLEHEVPTFAAMPEATIHYDACDYSKGCAVVLGSEADGLTDCWQHEKVTPIKLPMLGIADSLNVSVTAAVLMYEALRQSGNDQS